MIIARCSDCNFVARFNSNYYLVSELQRHLNSGNNNSEQITEEGLCDHHLNFQEETS